MRWFPVSHFILVMSGHFLRSCGEAQKPLPVDLKRLIANAMYYGMGLNMVEQC
jgi:hypothetical protein